MITTTLLGSVLAAAMTITPRTVPRDRVYELIVDGKRVGYSRYTVVPTRQGISITSETRIHVAVLGSPLHYRYRGKALYSAKHRQPIRYDLRLERGGQKSEVSVSIVGTSARLTQTSGGTRTTKTMPWSRNTWLVEGNCLDTWNMALHGAPSPLPRKITILSLSTGQLEHVELRRPGTEVLTSDGKQRLCDRVVIGTASAEIELLVARDTRDVLEMRVPGQNAVFRRADASALTGIATLDAGARLFSIVEKPLPTPQELTRLKVRARFEIVGQKPTPARLQLPYQTFTGTVRDGLVEGVFETRRYQYGGERAPALAQMPPSDPSLARYLKPEANVESDHPEIRQLAAELVSGSRTAWDAVVRIGNWIKGNISYTVTGSGALQCLRSKKGDCGPQTWLTIALCRAAGIPARITGGVLYSEALGGSFGQHYWTRVWMGEDGWVPIDTTTREVGTLSPAHITLWDLAGLKSVSVEVLDYQPKKSEDVRPPGPRTLYKPTVGETERWVFLADGREVGEQTAQCVRVESEQGRFYSEWTYAFRYSDASQTVRLTGTYILWEDGTPRRLTFEAEAANVRQTGTYSFADRTVEVDLTLGETPVKRSLPVASGTLLQMNNVLSLFSASTRILRLQPGESRTVSYFAASGLQRLDMTFRCDPETQKVAVGSVERSCVVAEVEPIKNRFYVDAETGELLRVEVPAAKLVIERR